jgi:hypothetical protein
MRVEVLRKVPDDLIEEFYGLYRAAFEPLRTLAAARQVLTPRSSPALRIGRCGIGRGRGR